MAYQQDVKTRFTGVKWGGGWLIATVAVTPFFIGTVVSNISHTADWRPDINATVRINFPGITGGGDGLLLCDAQTPLPGSRSIPYTVVDNDLKNTIITMGPSPQTPIPGFPLNLVITTIENNPPFFPFHTIQNAVAIKLAGPLAKPFTLHFDTTENNGNTQGVMQVALYKSGIIKTGVIIGADPNDPSTIGRPGASAFDFKVFGKYQPGDGIDGATNNTLADFAIDPQKFTVKAS